MQRTLSARSTPFLKFALPPIWMAGTGYVVWRLLTDPGTLLGSEVETLTPIGWILLALIGGSLIVLFAFVAPLKQVRLTESGLAISNYLRETTVPFDAILAIRQNWLPTFRLITLKLRPEFGWGSRVIFMPAGGQRFAFWRPQYRRQDPLVGELRRLAGLKA